MAKMRAYIFNVEIGESLKELHAPGMKRVSRGKLRACCSRDIEVLFEETLTNLTYDDTHEAAVTAHFADGLPFAGDVVIGADGPRSKVRELLLGSEKSKVTVLDVVQNITLVRYNNTEKAKHVRSDTSTLAIGYHSDGRFNVIFSTFPLLPPLTSLKTPGLPKPHFQHKTPRRPPPQNLDLPNQHLSARYPRSLRRR